MKENPTKSLPGIPVLLVLIIALLLGAFLGMNGVRAAGPASVAAGVRRCSSMALSHKPSMRPSVARRKRSPASNPTAPS